MSLSHKYKIGAGVIILFHACGLIGLNRGQYAPLFEQATWFTILLSFLLILWCDERESKSRLAVFLIVTFLIGMTIEVVGVHTGSIFGHYHYTPLLGLGIMGVPLMIGINWILMTYTTGTTVSMIDCPVWMKIIAGAILMTLCDRLLESFAIKHHLWIWDMGSSPTQNYIAWFVLSLVLQVIYQSLIPMAKNKLALIYLIVLTLFLIGDKVLSQ